MFIVSSHSSVLIFHEPARSYMQARPLPPLAVLSCKILWTGKGYFFTNRIISYWNFLPAEVVKEESFGIFSAKLNSVDLNKFCILGRA